HHPQCFLAFIAEDSYWHFANCQTWNTGCRILLPGKSHEFGEAVPGNRKVLIFFHPIVSYPGKNINIPPKPNSESLMPTHYDVLSLPSPATASRSDVTECAFQLT